MNGQSIINTIAEMPLLACFSCINKHDKKIKSRFTNVGLWFNGKYKGELNNAAELQLQSKSF